MLVPSSRHVIVKVSVYSFFFGHGYAKKFPEIACLGQEDCC
jgi:hypothetical protein